MRARASKISLIVFVTLLVFGGFLLSTPGNYWPWYALMAAFAVVPLALGPRWHRLAGAAGLALAAVLITSDVQAGKHFQERMHRTKIERTNGSSQ